MASGPPSSETTLLRVFREQRPRLWGFLVRGLGSPESAEDLLQETFLRAWDHRAELGSVTERGDRDAARRYIWRAARNLMIDEIRTKARQRRRGEGLHVVQEQEALPELANADPEEPVEHNDCLRAVRETVARLRNRRARRCLQLWMEGRSLSEIGERLRLEVGQVRGLLQRGKAEVILRATDRLRTRPASSGPAGQREGR